MAKIYYVECPKCKTVYYVDEILIEKQGNQVKMKCPCCKEIFEKTREDIVSKE